ncbi:MAG: response regulator transcription factor [Planctomycetota bacterium]
MKAKILIVDDDSIVRESLIKLINEEFHFTVCAKAENTNQALDVIEKVQVDLVIVNISLEGTGSAELAEKIKLRHPNLPILTLPTREFLNE